MGTTANLLVRFTAEDAGVRDYERPQVRAQVVAAATVYVSTCRVNRTLSEPPASLQRAQNELNAATTAFTQLATAVGTRALDTQAAEFSARKSQIDNAVNAQVETPRKAVKEHAQQLVDDERGQIGSRINNGHPPLREYLGTCRTALTGIRQEAANIFKSASALVPSIQDLHHQTFQAGQQVAMDDRQGIQVPPVSDTTTAPRARS